MYLSYSGFKKYKDCPRAYWHCYVNHTKTAPDNRVGMLYGSITGTLFELFYRDKLWKESDPVAALYALVDSVAKDTVAKEGKSGILNWKDKKLRNGPRSMEEVLTDVRSAIPNGVRIIRKHRLLGTMAKAEVKLDSPIGGHTLGGRCDFLIERLHPLKDLVILDGKGSKYRDQYVDFRQLQWYSILHRAKFGRLPDQVAFLYWRSDPETAVDWSTPIKSEIDEFQEEILTTVSTIEERKRLRVSSEGFPTRANPSNCRFCNYVTVCSDGQVMVSENRPSVSSDVGVEDVTLE